MKTTVLSPITSAHLDLVRGGAALLVLLSHARNLFFRDYRDLGSYQTLTNRILYFLTGLGHEAVIVFFVLSGFLVGGSVLKASIKFSWPTYLVARTSRLYVVLIPALLVVFVCDSIGPMLSGGQFWYASVLPHFNSAPFSASISAKIFLGNLLFLQTILVPPFGSDGPLWSLANEFWYY